MDLTLLRHPPPDVAPGTCYGATDLPLRRFWQARAAALAVSLPRARCVVASPLGRCRALAARIALLRGLPLRVDPRWREMDFGAWEGRPWNAIPRAELDAWAADFHTFADHGGESVAALERRVRAALAATPAGALVVTHAGCIKAALAIRGQGDGWAAQPGFGEPIPLAPPPRRPAVG